ncbi:MAG: DUF1684 domain-containing protein [Bacteroidota bacterium]
MFRVLTSLLLITLCPFFHLEAQSSYLKDILTLRTQKDLLYNDSLKSPIPKEYLPEFIGLDYFDVNEDFMVTATLRRTKKPTAAKFKTSNPDVTRQYLVYGIVEFTLLNKESELTIYYTPRTAGLRKSKRKLFLPFRDKSNGVSTYGGGRYLELEIPEGDQLTIDFNKAFNPLCAYGGTFACVIPPAENLIKVEVEAGEKDFIH